MLPGICFRMEPKIPLKQVLHELIVTEARGWGLGPLLYNSIHICNCVKFFNGEKAPWNPANPPGPQSHAHPSCWHPVLAWEDDRAWVTNSAFCWESSSMFMPKGSVVSNSVIPWTVAYQAPLCDFPNKNTGVSCHFLLYMAHNRFSVNICWLKIRSVQFSSVAQSCPTLCDPVDYSTPGLPAHHQLLQFTQTHVHWVGDATQPSHPLSSPLLLP